MEFHRGRLIDHVHLRASNLEASKRFYRAVFQALQHRSRLSRPSRSIG